MLRMTLSLFWPMMRSGGFGAWVVVLCMGEGGGKKGRVSLPSSDVPAKSASFTQFPHTKVDRSA